MLSKIITINSETLKLIGADLKMFILFNIKETLLNIIATFIPHKIEPIFLLRQCKKHQGPYLQRLIFFATYDWAQKGRSLHYDSQKRLFMYKHSNSLVPFVK
jgi:hypothetical protein